MMLNGGMVAFFGIVYGFVVVAVAILAIWTLVLLNKFLRLRIAEMKSADKPRSDEQKP